MPDVVITVQGRARSRIPAEQGTLRIGIHAEGPVRDEVMGMVVQSAASVRDLVGSAGDAVATSSSDSARAWSEKPWNQDGRQLDPVFHARVEMIAILTDASALARLVDDAVLLAGVEIDGIEWSLTDASHQEALAEVRREAVSDAERKASAYAAALGLENVHPLALADAGMLDGSGAPGGQPVGVMRASMASDSAGLAFTPQPIEVEAVVDARFAAS